MESPPAATQDVVDQYWVVQYPAMGPIIAFLYLLMAKVILPKYMENKPAYKLKTILKIYNVIQVYINVKCLLLSFKPGIWSQFWRVHCLPINHEIPYYREVADAALLYVYIKLFDLFDTVFIILKKKSSQLSFLHLFHHSMVVTIAFISYSDKEKLGFPILMLNSFVHVIMYSYYFIASFESQRWISKYKKYVTQLQLTQFGMMLVYLIYNWVRGCPWGWRCQILWNFVLSVLIYQFSMFYYKEYVKRKTKSKK